MYAFWPFSLKRQTFEMGFKVQVFGNDTFIFSGVMCMGIVFSL